MSPADDLNADERENRNPRGGDTRRCRALRIIKAQVEIDRAMDQLRQALDEWYRLMLTGGE